MINISIVTAIRNEEENIEEYLQRLYHTLNKLNVSFEIIFVTDTNTDRTYDILKEKHIQDPRIKVIKLSCSRGQYIAIMAGLDYATGSVVVTMDCDLQDYPEDIEALYRKQQQGYDVVYGVKKTKDDSRIRNMLSKIYLFILNKLSDIELDHNTNIFRIMSQRAVRAIRSFPEQNPSLTGISSLVGFQTAKVDVSSGTRLRGKTKYDFFALTSLAFDTIFSFTVKPLRLISLLGIVISFLSLCYLVVELIKLAVARENVVSGWPTIISFIIFLGGIQLASLGIIGEYVGRIFLETKKRPLYLTEEIWGDFSRKP